MSGKLNNIYEFYGISVAGEIVMHFFLIGKLFLLSRCRIYFTFY